MISPLAYVDSKAKIGNNTRIYPFAYIDADVEIGDNCTIMPYVSVMSGTTIGNNTKIYQGSIIGADPQDFRWHGEKTYLRIGDNNVIRENVIINRSIREGKATVIGNDSFIMAKSHIAHDSIISDRCVLGNGAIVAGDCKIGECTILSSASIVHEGTDVGEWVVLKGGCRVAENVPPYTIIAHNPAAFFGVNAVIMRKHGFSEEDIDDAAKCYRHIYQCGTSVFNALRRIEADVNDANVRKNVLEFVRSHDLRIVAVPKDMY